MMPETSFNDMKDHYSSLVLSRVSAFSWDTRFSDEAVVAAEQLVHALVDRGGTPSVRYIDSALARMNREEMNYHRN